MSNNLPALPQNHFDGGANVASSVSGNRSLWQILSSLLGASNKSLTSDEVAGKVVVTAMDAEGTPTADSRNIRCAIQNIAGAALPGARNVKIRALANTNGQGTLAAATATPKGTVRKTNNATAGENVQTMAVDPADGVFAFALGNTQAGANQVDVEIIAEGCLPVAFSVPFT